jgi:transcription antitermination factor NusG
MPILAPEPALFPENLFEATPGDVAERRWSVIHTRPRQEKSLARYLYERDIAFYLPLLPSRVRVRKQIVYSYNPLFASYLFLLANSDDRLLALGTRRIAAALDVNDQAKLWTDLRQVHRLIGSGLPVTAEERLTPGTSVQIREGPLMGLRGVIVKSVSGNRFIVTVDFIQRGASVVLSDSVLSACPPEMTGCA